MIRLRTVKARSSRATRVLVFLLTLSMAIGGVAGCFTDRAEAAATTVTLRYGSSEFYGTGSYGGGWTTIKWVTHIDGEPIDLDEIPGVSRSYAYCVQPTTKSPDPGTYTVTLVDDDDTGRVAKMRKLIYYLPGSYGYGKVGYKRWFANSNTGASDYAVGHMALSWIHSNYSESVSEVWDGVSATMERKVKEIVEDLDNLPDPPERFEVFWVKVSGRQDVFGAFYSTEFGSAKVVKTSAWPGLTNGNSAYSPKGAEYTLYTDENCKTVAKTADGVDAVLVTKDDGNSDEISIETGDYYVKETKAPKGYALDTKIRAISVVSDKTTTLNVQDVPIHCRVNILFNKLDKDSSKAKAEGDAGLADAVYRFSYYDGYYSSASAAEASGVADSIWYFKTDSNGRISGRNPSMAEGYSSSALYKDNSGNVIFLLGTYVIQEVKPSSGYLLNDEKLIVQIKEDGRGEATVYTYNENISGKEQVMRGGVRVSKVDNDIDTAYAQGDASLAEAEFTIYNKSKEAVMVGGKEIAKDAAALVIKTNAEGIAASAANALPYGTYLIKETKAPAGYNLNSSWSKEFSIRQNGQIVDLTTDAVRESVIRSGVQIVKRDKEIAKSEALGGASLEGIVMTIKNVSDHDVVVAAELGNKDNKINWRNADSKNELFETEQIKRVKPGEDVGKIMVHWNEDKSAYTAETLPDDLPFGTYTIRESKTTGSYQRTDKSEHRFEVREDGTVYAYGDEGLDDILCFDNYVYRSDLKGTKIGDGDSKRFSYVPFKITSLSNGESHVVVTDKNGFFSTEDRRTADSLDEDEDADTSAKVNPFDDLLDKELIKREDIEKRSGDILMGAWFGTGEFGTKAEHNPSYGALPYDSYIIEEMACEQNLGYGLQKFFFTIEDKTQNGVVDLETITNKYKDVPELATQAGVGGINRGVSPNIEITLVDVIKYSNLVKGETYTVRGRLMDKSSDEVVKDANGEEVVAETTFTAKRRDGRTEVTFKFDGSEMHGMDTVVYEKLYDANGLLVASHEDKDNLEQTVTWKEPDIPETPETPERPKTPDTGDSSGLKLLYPLLAIAISAEGLLLTKKRRNDRLN